MSSEFEGFLHNPWAQPDPIDATAIALAKRKERFFEGYDPVEDAQEVLREHFSDNDTSLEATGLRCRFESLAKRVVETEGMIAIFVALAHVAEPMAPFRTYVTDEGNTIKLEARNVARRLISEYITRRKSTQLCKNLPGFDIAYETTRRKYRAMIHR